MENSLEIFAKLFNTGYRRQIKEGDEYRVADPDHKVQLARKIIEKNNLPLEVLRPQGFLEVRAFLVKEV